MDSNPIYKFMKDNGLTQKDEATFVSEYSNPQKSAELHKFMTDNGLTTKGADDFYSEYFAGSKKKEPTTTGSSQPAKPSPPSFGQKVVTEALVSGEPVMKGVKKEPQKKEQDITFRRQELPSETTQAQIPQMAKTIKSVEEKAQEGKFVQSPVTKISEEKGTDWTSDETIKKVNQKAFEKSQQVLQEKGVNLLSKEDVDDQIKKEYEAQFGEEIDSYMDNAGNKSDKFFPYFTVAPADLSDLQIALGQREVPNGTTIEKEGKRGEITSALMDDYFTYMKAKYPEAGEAEQNKYQVLKSRADRSAKDEEWLHSMETRAIQLKMAAVKRNYEKQKAGVNEYSQIEASIDTRMFDSGMIALNKERAAIDSEYKRLNERASQSSETPDFTQLQERERKLQEDYETLKVKSRMTDENVAKLQQAKSAYQQLGQSALSLKALGAMNQDNINYYSEYSTLKDQIEKAQEAGKQRWENASPLMKMVYAPGELANTFASGIGNLALNVVEIPKVVEDLVTGNTEYNFLDEFYDGVENYRMEKQLDFPNIDSESTTQYLSALGGNTLSSLAVFALGGTFGGSSKMAQFGSTFTSSMLTTEVSAYEEAINTHKMSPRQAAASSTAVAVATSLVEGLIPDVKYFEPSAFRRSMLNEIASGKSVSQALRSALPESAESYLLSGLKEGGEELAQQTADDGVKKLINYIGETEYFKDLLNGRAYQDAVLGGLIGGGVGNFFKRPVGASNISENVMLEAAENADGIIAAYNNNDNIAKVERDLKAPRQDFMNLSAHPNWKNLDRPKKARAFGITQQIRTLEETNLKDPIINAQIERLKNERQEILSIGENGISAKSVGTSTTPQRVKVGGEYASFFINEDGDYEIEYNNGRSVIVEKGEGVVDKIREMGIETDEGIVGDMNIENQNTLITPALEKGATINYAGKNATLNNYAEKKGKIVSVNITTEDGKTLQIREGQQGNSKQLLENLNSLKYDKENQVRVSSEVGEGKKPVEAKPVEAPSAEAPKAGGVLQAPEEEVAPEVTTEEVKANMKPITDEMAKVEMEFDNNGFSIDWDYDNEIIITNKKTGETVDAEELPESLLPLAAQYEKATSGLAGYDFNAYQESLKQSRSDVGGIETDFEEVKPAALPEKTEPAKPSRKERLAGLFKEEEKPAEEPVEETKPAVTKEQPTRKGKIASLFEQEEAPQAEKQLSDEDFVDEKIEQVKQNGKPLSEFKEGDRVIWANDSNPFFKQYVEGVVVKEKGEYAIKRSSQNPLSKKYPVAVFNGSTRVILKPEGDPIYTGEENIVKKQEAKTAEVKTQSPKAGPEKKTVVRPTYEVKVENGTPEKDGFIRKQVILRDGKVVKEFVKKSYRDKDDTFERAMNWLEKEVGPIDYQTPFELFSKMFEYHNRFREENPDELIGEGYDFAANKMVEEQGISRELADYLEDKIQYMGDGYVKSLKEFETYQSKIKLALDIEKILSQEDAPQAEGEPSSVTASDGWTFVRMPNGTYTDGDQVYESWEQLKEVGQKEDLGLRQSTPEEEERARKTGEEEGTFEAAMEVYESMQKAEEAPPVETKEASNKAVNELIAKKNRYNKIPKTKKAMGANLLNQIKQEAENLGFNVVNVKGGNISLTSKDSGKVVARRDVDRKFNQERNNKLKEAKSMAGDSLFGLRGSVLLYFLGGGKVKTSQSELAGEKEIEAAKRAGFIADNGRGVDMIVLEDLPTMGGIVFDEQDAINEVLDVLASFENKTQMEDELVEMVDKLNRDMNDAMKYRSISEMNEALDKNELDENQLREYYEALSEDEKVKSIEDYEKFYQEIERQQSDREGKGAYGVDASAEQEAGVEEPKAAYEESGVKDFYSSVPGLKNIGTLQQYAEYLNSIFPNSKVKEILYRGYRSQGDKGKYFTPNKDYTRTFGSLRKAVVVNAENLLDLRDYDIEMDEGLIKNTGRQVEIENLWVEKDVDIVDLIEKADAVVGIDSGMDEVAYYVKNETFELGTKEDLGAFEKFVKTPKSKTTYGTEEGLTRTDTAAGPFVSESGNAPYSEPGGVRGEDIRSGGVGNTVKAVWNKYKQIKFNGSTKVKDADDVAHIMRKLEDKSVEHAFAVHVTKRGKTHIQFLGMGGPTSTVVDPRLVLAGVKKFKSAKVYLVHNHPSGSLAASRPDISLTNQVEKILSPLGIKLEHIIMDTYKKQYVHLLPEDTYYLTREFPSEVRDRDISKENLEEYNKALKVEVMDEQRILSRPVKDITNSADVADFLMQTRFTALPKHGMLLLNNQNQIIGNYIFKKGFNYDEAVSFYAESATGTNVILYSNQNDYTGGARPLMNLFKAATINVLDYVLVNSDSEGVKGYYTSFADSDRLNETQAKYGTNSIPNELREPTPRTNAEIQSLMENAADAVEQSIASGTDPQTAVNNIVSGQEWYNGLTSKLKQQFDEILQDEFGATPKAQPKAKAPAAKPATKGGTDIQNIVDNYYKLKDGDRSARTAINEILDRDPKLKYIYDNIAKINKQLQDAGVITAKTDGCP